MSDVARLTLPDLQQAIAGRDAVLFASERADNVLGQRLLVRRATLEEVGAADIWIVSGGGTLIDEVKLKRFDERPDAALFAIPTIWGSGAEVSPIAIVTRAGRKVIRIDRRLLPTARVIIDGFALTVSPRRALDACGDVWAHALEAFFSPLATDAVRTASASLVREMLADPRLQNARWFDWSARACEAQAVSSVGLVHGLAHVLEERMPLGHAALCATLSWPVMLFNAEQTPRYASAAAEAGLDWAAILARLHALFDAERYAGIVNVLSQAWPTVLRDPCTRTNGVLVRPAHLDFFTHFATERT